MIQLCFETHLLISLEKLDLDWLPWKTHAFSLVRCILKSLRWFAQNQDKRKRMDKQYVATRLKRHKRRVTYSVEEFSAGTVLEKDELSVVLHPTAVALNDVRMFQQFVNANFLSNRFLQKLT